MMMIWTTGLSICIDIDMIWNMTTTYNRLTRKRW